MSNSLETSNAPTGTSEEEHRATTPDQSPAAGNLSAAPAGQRVLLLEDDEALKEIIGQFFTENGYAVTAVMSGGDAVKEVLAADFSIILCDMILPDLHGDLFYRAVERARPHLCDRFVFMTGHSADASIGDFIKEVNGCVLLKPFQLQDLLDLVHAIETRRKFAKWQGRSSVDKTSGALRNRDRVAPQSELSLSPQTGAATAESSSVPTPVVLPSVPRPVLVHVAVEPRWKSMSPFFGTLLWVACLLGLAGISGSRYFDLRARTAVLSVELADAEKQWGATSAQLQEAETRRRKSEALVKRVKRIAEDRDAPRLSLALRSVARAVGASEVLQDLHAYEEPAARGACNLRLTGVCTGREPRAVADRFRQVLEANLKPYFGGESVATRFERLDEEPPSTSAAPGAPQQKATFTIIATTTSKRLPASDKAGKR